MCQVEKEWERQTSRGKLNKFHLSTRSSRDIHCHSDCTRDIDMIYCVFLTCKHLGHHPLRYFSLHRPATRWLARLQSLFLYKLFWTHRQISAEFSGKLKKFVFSKGPQPDGTMDFIKKKKRIFQWNGQNSRQDTKSLQHMCIFKAALISW